MLQYKKSFCVIGVANVSEAEKFYRDKLGLVSKGEQWPGSQLFEIGDGKSFILYNDKNHRPGTGAVLTFHVDDIDAAVDGLVAAGIGIDKEDAAGPTDARGILHIHNESVRLNVALFKDPSGNILSLLQFE